MTTLAKKAVIPSLQNRLWPHITPVTWRSSTAWRIMPRAV